MANKRFHSIEFNVRTSHVTPKIEAGPTDRNKISSVLRVERVRPHLTRIRSNCTLKCIPFQSAMEMRKTLLYFHCVWNAFSFQIAISANAQLGEFPAQSHNIWACVCVCVRGAFLPERKEQSRFSTFPKSFAKSARRMVHNEWMPSMR